MLIVSTDFQVNNQKLFEYFKSRLSRPDDSPGGFLRVIRHDTYCIFCPDAPLFIDGKFDPDMICESLSHILPRGSKVSMYIIDDGNIDTFYISDTTSYRV